VPSAPLVPGRVWLTGARVHLARNLGLAFPTCVSINDCVCHQSPLASDKEIVLREGDLVKVYASAHRAQ
jgi:methionine aminopeptidase